MAWKAQGHSVDELPFRALGGIWGSVFGATVLVLVLIAQVSSTNYISTLVLTDRTSLVVLHRRRTHWRIWQSRRGCREFLLELSRISSRNRFLHCRLPVEANWPKEGVRNRPGYWPKMLVYGRGVERLGRSHHFSF